MKLNNLADATHQLWANFQTGTPEGSRWLGWMPIQEIEVEGNWVRITSQNGALHTFHYMAGPDYFVVRDSSAKPDPLVPEVPA